jgi:hypothetical protein
MKKLLLSSLAIVLSAAVHGQSSRQTTPNHLKKALKINKNINQPVATSLDNNRDDYAPTASELTVLSNGVTEQIIGETYYDLQTNSAIQNRLFVHEDNSISATWTISPNKNGGFPDRGSGYNYFDGSEWLDFPTARIESNRTGWPSVIGYNGGEIVASHTVTETGTNINFATRESKGTGDWSENLLPAGIGTDLDNVWPRIKVGGADNNSLHMISHTADTENPYVTYSRSLDGGETWDIVDSILPEISSDYYVRFSGDSYALDVKGETVAFVLGASWTDVILMKSTDNGNTWTKTIVKEHPLPMFDDDVIVDTLSFPETGGTIENADQSFSLSLDANGNAHIFYGLMEYANSTLNDESWSYYPATDGLVYWNETTAEEEVIAYIIDENGNDTLDIETTEHIAYYGKSLTSFPSSVIADNGDIYLTYSSINEFLYDQQIELGNYNGENYMEHYRHQFIMRSQDGGVTWSEPFDLMKEITDPSLGDPLQEGVYGCISNIVNDNVYITYQRDVYPGINIQTPDGTTADPITLNSIVFLQIPIAEFENLDTEEISRNEELFSIYPNPSNNFVNVKLANNKDEARINIINVLGETVLSTTMSDNQLQLSIESLKNGVYWVSVETSTNRSIKSLVKH